MNITNISKNLKLHSNGIYYSETKSNISYPEDGNTNCFQIENESFWFKHRNKIITELIEKYSPRDSFFDIGGGNGYMTKTIQDIIPDTVLLEPGNEGVLNAKKRGVKNIICSTLHDADLHKESICSVGLFDVIEHIKDDCNFLKSLFYYMKKKSFIFITVPAHNFLWSRHDDYSGHCRRYKESDLNNLVSESGFTPVFSTYFFSFLIIPVLFLRALPFKLGIKNPENRHALHKREHSSFEKNRFLKSLMKWESAKINRGQRLFTGSSCLIVAVKK